MSPHEVLVVGSINQDQILVVDRLPAPGETVLAVRTDRSAGGKGANQAVAVAAGGVRVRLVGAVGADSAGQSVLTSLAERGVDIEGVQVRPGYTGLAVVTVDAQGENSIVVAPGANATVDPETLHDALSTIPAQSIVLAQGELPARVIEATGRAARAAQSTFVLNLAPAISLDLTVAAPAVLIVNESELALIAQAHDIPSGSESERAAALATAFGMDVLVTLGKRGALACTAIACTWPCGGASPRGRRQSSMPGPRARTCSMRSELPSDSSTTSARLSCTRSGSHHGPPSA